MSFDSATPRSDVDRRLRSPRVVARRLAFFGAVGGTVAIGSLLLVAALRQAESGPFLWLIGALFIILFAWIALAFWTAVAGFVLRLLGRDALSLRTQARSIRTGEPLSVRTALAMPIHNESPGRVMDGLAAMGASLANTGEAAAFEVFLLSDTSDTAIAREEEFAVADLRARLPAGLRLHYRHRESNAGRKAGNIADFCRRWGARYQYMIVLDADSLMTGATLVELVRYMEANPEAGLIQTVPIPVRQRTLFGRLLQYAGAAYSPMLASGLAFWQGDAANYWGHNAIVRVQPFTDHCGLPDLPGRPPLGGEILSHDFVEAALMRRAGWQVWLLPDLEGSYEEIPVNVLDYAKRDRRWTQGNLQHLRLLLRRGWHPVSRLHFLMGAMTYLASPLWLLLVLVTTVGAARGHGDGPMLVGLPGAAYALMGGTLLLLVGPRLLGSVLLLVRRRRVFGGSARIAVNGGLELLFSVMLAPALLCFHTSFVVQILRGQTTSWQAQQREGRMVAWRDALRGTAFLALPALLAACALAWLSMSLVWWLLPVLLPLIVAPLLVRVTSWHAPAPGGGEPVLGVPAERGSVDVLKALAAGARAPRLEPVRQPAPPAVPPEHPRLMPIQTLPAVAVPFVGPG